MSTPRSLDLPACVDARTVTTPRGTFAVHDARVPSGTARRGHVLLVPGFTGSKEDFDPILPLLAEQGWHATAYDQRGQYETLGKPDDDYSLDGLASDALALQEAIAPQSGSHLVGHSFGGLVAAHAVLADDAAWRTVTLVCSGPAGFGDEAVLACAPGTEDVSRLESFVAAIPALGAERVFEIQHADDDVSPSIRAFLRTRFLANAPESLCAIAQHLIDAPDVIDALATTSVRANVLYGADDDAWPHASQELMARRLGTEAVIVPDAAHSPAVEQPAATAQALIAAWATSERLKA